MIIRERSTNIPYELFIADGVLGYEISTEQPYELDPIIFDKQNNRYYQLYIADTVLGWEEVAGPFNRFVELVDRVTNKTLEICFYEGQLAWQEKTISKSGSIKKLFYNPIYVPRKIYFNIDGVRKLSNNVIFFLCGVLVSYVTELRSLLGLTKFAEASIFSVAGLVKFIESAIATMIARTKILVNSSYELPNKFRVGYNDNTSIEGTKAFRRLSTADISAIRRFEVCSISDIDGYKQTKVPKIFTSTIHGKIDYDALLVAMGIFNKTI